MTSRKKPGVAFWATVVVVALIAYPLSWGPAYWVCGKVGGPEWGWQALSCIYSPMHKKARWAPDRVRNALDSYYYWWNPDARDPPQYDPDTDSYF